MGVLPLQFKDGDSVKALGLTGKEKYTIHIDDNVQPGQTVKVEIADDEQSRTIEAICRLDTPVEVEYYRNGGILHTVLRNFIKE